jgi:N-acylneuraminate cytidylyltransferase/CMP-N,N'-diacetyllegionaminic acid synthase
MKKKLMILAVIIARGGSKGVLKKNIKKLAGKPLISYTIDAALNARTLDKVIVSTDDREIAKIAQDLCAEVPFMRPKYLAQDATPVVPVVQHAVKIIEKLDGRRVDIVVLLQPTSPLRIVSDIDKGVRKLVKTKADSVVGVCKLEYLCHPYLIKRLKGDRIYPYLKSKRVYDRRQEVPNLYRLNGALYVVQRDTLMKKGTFFGKDLRALIMDHARSIDIDTKFDFKVAEFILENLRRKFI